VEIACQVKVKPLSPCIKGLGTGVSEFPAGGEGGEGRKWTGKDERRIFSKWGCLDNIKNKREGMMKIKKLTGLWIVQVSIILSLTLVLNSCSDGDEKVCCSETGGISLDFSSLPVGAPLVMFTVDKVVGIRIYDEIKLQGTSLWCEGREEVPPGSGNWEDAAVMFLFCRLPCSVCAITAEVHGHGNEARIVATQLDGTTQTAVCPGNKKVLKLNAATRDNPFIYAILSGQEAEWLRFKLE
jgi:hypothetical protein